MSARHYTSKHSASYSHSLTNFPFGELNDQQLREEIILCDARIRGLRGNDIHNWQAYTDYLVAAAKEKRRRVKAQREMLRFG